MSLTKNRGRSRRLWPGLWLCCLLATPVGAVEVHTISDGNSLAEGCHQALQAGDPPPPGAFACLNYLRGVLDALQHANRLARLRLAQATGGERLADLYCLPVALPYGEAARIVFQHARRHPELATQSAERLTLAALQAAFPCAGGR